MKAPKLAFKSKTTGAHHRTRISSSSFAQRLYRAGILRRDEKGRATIGSFGKMLQVDLRGAGYLDLWDFATLAVLIRKIAQSGITIEINWPGSYRGELSGLQQFLEGLRFRELFSREFQGNQDWLNNIRIPQTEMTLAELSTAGQSRYVPLTWIDKGSYDYNGNDLWRVHPKLSCPLEAKVRKLFLKEGFNDLETIDEINHTFLYELGWNIVLHSDAACGDGFGVFCAQLSYESPGGFPDRPSIALCVCDCGLGIPTSLAASFETAVKNGGFNQHFTAGTESQIVRYSFDPHATSRPVHSSEIDKTGTRGLAHVARAIQGVGSTVLRSDGGAVSLTGSEGAQLDYEYDDKLASTPLPGTQAIIFLRKQRKKVIHEHKLLPSGQKEFEIVHLTNSDGTCKVTGSPEAQHFISAIPNNQTGLLFDFGFSDDNGRQVEYLVTHAVERFPHLSLFFWNVRSFVQLDPFFERLSKQKGAFKCLAFGGQPEKAVIIATKTQLEAYSFNKVIPNLPAEALNSEGVAVLRGQWQLQDYIRTCKLINTHLLEVLCRMRLNRDGVFSGIIHLPSGKSVSRYFSFLDHTRSVRTRNMARWVESCGAAANLIVERSGKRSSNWTILAFAGSARDLCWQVCQRISLPASCAHVLIIHELPTKRDIAALVRSGDNVLLLTDAISMGTLASEVISLVKEVGGVLHGIVSCVDARIEPPSDKDRFSYNSAETTLISCAELFSGSAHVTTKTDDEEFWVDPVCLVPQKRNTWQLKETVLAAVNETIDVVVQTSAAVCGHLIDGTRHTSVYVRVDRLVREAQPLLERLVHQKMNDRLQNRRWDNFKPSCVIYPFGTARIEALGNRSALNYDPDFGAFTPAGLVAEIVRAPWPEARLVEVSRAFDSGGRSRCSKGTLPVDQEVVAGNDVLVVDDGMWRGTTANTLLRLAVEMGAARVVIVPLLARFASEELEYWESIAEVFNEATRKPVPCCYVFPLFLPIPFVNEAECPYEATLKRIKDKLVARSFNFAIPEHLLARLRGHNPASATSRDQSFTRAWLQFRSLAELATRSEPALAQLLKLVRTDNPTTQSAIFELLLEEWPLLGRPRIRQTIAPVVRERAQHCLRNGESTLQAQLAALSFLRSHHLQDFLDVLHTLPDSMVKEPICFERILLHMATLREDLLGSDRCLAFFDRLAAVNLIGGARGDHGTEIRREGTMVQDCYRLWLQSRMLRHSFKEGKRKAAIQIKSMLEDRSVYTSHEVKGFLRVLSEMRNDGNSTPETFSRLLEKWQEKHLTFFAEVLLPMVKELRAALMCVATDGLALQPTWAEYLISEKTTIFRATTDLAHITESLSQLASGTFGKMPLQTLAGGAQRLLQNVIDRDSYLLRLVNGLCARTVEEFLNDFSSDLKLRLARLGVSVSTHGEHTIERSGRIFGPRHMLSSCINHISDNLEKYAFVPYPEDPNSRSLADGKVEIRLLQETLADATPVLVIEVLDNGNSMPQNRSLGRGTTWLNSNLQDIDALFEGPRECHEVPWVVVQRTKVLLW